MAYEIEQYEEETHSVPRYAGRFMVAVYEMGRRYGGPEEGGWWYDSGNLFRLVSVEKNVLDAFKKVNRANHLFYLVRRKTFRTDRHSMAYQGGDYEFRVYAGVPPVHFPKVRPHYE